MNQNMKKISLVVFIAFLLIGCESAETPNQSSSTTAAPTETAKQFVDRIQKEMVLLSKELEAAYWVRATYITPDTAVLAAKAGERWLEFQSSMVKQAQQFRDAEMDVETARAIELILRGSAAPCTKRPRKTN